jgi:hypothetical protein
MIHHPHPFNRSSVATLIYRSGESILESRPGSILESAEALDRKGRKCHHRSALLETQWTLRRFLGIPSRSSESGRMNPSRKFGVLPIAPHSLFNIYLRWRSVLYLF